MARSIAPLDGGMIKRSAASLVGGIAVAIGTMALWVALVHDLGMGSAGMMALGMLVCGGAGLWIWRADL